MNVTSDIMMMVLPYVKNVTTDVIHVPMKSLVTLVMNLPNTELLQMICVHAKEDTTKTQPHYFVHFVIILVKLVPQQPHVTHV